MSYFKKQLFAFLASCFFVLFSVNSHAESKISTSYFSSVAVSGYDTVAYFSEQKATKGDSDFSVKYQDATWHFSSKKNADLFSANPKKYAPQFGGYCAWAISQNHIAKSDPLAWKIIDNKLYLNYDFEVQAMWLKDPKKRIEMANKNWPSILK